MLTDLDAVESGMSPDVMTDFLNSVGLELKDIYDIIIPARTLTHRRARGGSLTRDESDKLARLIRIYEHTARIFGAREKVLHFLRAPKQSFEGRSPLQMLRTEVGGRMVDDMLWGIADGVYI